MTSDHGSPGLTGRGLDVRIVRQNILGPMELEVLARIAEGLSDAEIARHRRRRSILRSQLSGQARSRQPAPCRCDSTLSSDDSD